MAVAYDVSADNVASGSGTTLAVNLTVGAGSNLALIVVALGWTSGGGYVAVQSVSGAGASWAGSPIGSLQSTVVGEDGRFEIWGGVAPSTGAQTVTVTWASAVIERYVAVFSFNGVDQTTPLANFASSAASGTQNITTTSGDAAVSHISYQGSAPTISGCTTTVDQAGAVSYFYAATKCLASGASVNFTWSGTTLWGVVGAAVKQVAGGATLTPPVGSAAVAGVAGYLGVGITPPTMIRQG